jgi:peptide/nickel transport system permease protein
VTAATRLGIGFAVAIGVLALAGPWLAGDPLAQPDPIAGALRPPSTAHWLGTDQYSRDVLARLAHGARLSIGIAVVAIAVAGVLGTAFGLLAGGTPGWPGRILSHVIDLALALPRIVVLLVLVAAVGVLPPMLLGAVLGLTGWPAIARLVRGEALQLRHAGHVMAATALGSPPPRILLREVLPGTLPPALIAATLGLADVLLLEAGLSFLGIGVRPPAPTWGNMILEAQPHIGDAPWLLLAPGMALVVATAAATLLGDALRARLQLGSR